MRTVTVEELKYIDFSIRDIDADTWYWADREYSETPEGGRPTSGLCFLVRGAREYYEGSRIVAQNEAGSLIFLQVNQHSVSRAICAEGDSFGYNFRFNLYDEQGNLLCVDAPYRKVKDNASRQIEMLCQGLYDPRRTDGNAMLRKRACLYSMLDLLFGGAEEERTIYREYPEIAPAVIQLQTFPEHHFSTKELCDLCGLGENRFRQHFEQFSGGVTPVQYRNRLLCEKAEQYYTRYRYSLTQIAEKLGFSDVGYLCRLYKQTCGRNFREMKR